jgi:hypothetical protein
MKESFELRNKIIRRDFSVWMAKKYVVKKENYKDKNPNYLTN